MAKRKMRRKRAAPPEERFEVLRQNAAGIDIGSRGIWVSVPPSRCDESVQAYGVVTGELHKLADWLHDCGIDTVAMESTGVYWVPLYEILEERGFDVWLVNSREVKSVPGRKSDVLDCQWIRRLHTYGLLRRSFRPSAEIVELRQYLRQRDTLISDAADQVRRMHKALTLMNIQIQTVISDITGQTGMAILRDIVAGVRDPKTLANHRHYRCHASVETIEQALTGNYKREHVFALRHALRQYDLNQELVAECDTAAAQLLDALHAQAGREVQPTPKKNLKRKQKEATVDYRTRFKALVGVDLTAVPGLADYSVAALVSEIGTDMTQWPTSRHFASWLRIVPRSDITGGKPKNRRTLPTTSRAVHLLRMAAMNAGRTNTAIGAFYRNFARRKGKAEAVVATAHKLARIIYAMLRNQTEFHDVGQDGWEQDRRERTVRNLKRRAKALGLRLVEDVAQ
jgi:transposase